MKKLLFVAIVALLSLASCTKDRVCTCTTESSGITTTSSTTYFASHKRNAQLACEMKSTETDQITPASMKGSKTTCTLK